ncbi:MAG TPA: hypothetical protein VJV78_30420 [Polyangiales bacterium]|nr:hypothetical protein [Polyangiales bacterium]
MQGNCVLFACALAACICSSCAADELGDEPREVAVTSESLCLQSVLPDTGQGLSCVLKAEEPEDTWGSCADPQISQLELGIQFRGGTAYGGILNHFDFPDGRVCRTASFSVEIGCRNSDSSWLEFRYSPRRYAVLEPEVLNSQSPLAVVQCPPSTPIPFGATLTMEYQGAVTFE